VERPTFSVGEAYLARLSDDGAEIVLAWRADGKTIGASRVGSGTAAALRALAAHIESSRKRQVEMAV
jgi:hypothetical protein